MTDRGGKIRLFVAAGIEPGAGVALTPEQAHYLFAVMRQGVGGRIAVFNGRDGEWAAEIAEAGRRGGRLVVRERTRPQQASPDLWLMFAPLKKARTDFVVEKATELGVACLRPVFTRRTNAERLRGERLRGMASVLPASLGPRILRADTAAVAALTLWQALLGDWR